ncbi:hypothetical protein C8R42DRAFT_114301 [Lentinula raphanica]|nr:hypothetical protein C8R42DRAFT_114301 [Lentinula raphanica]
MTTYNPVLAEGRFALDPRFVVQASELANKRESSIQFAVSDSQVAEAILRGKVLNMFGKACKVRKYQDRTPTNPQCRRCKAFGHRADKCKAQERCALCGREDHNELQHTLQCGSCRDNPRYNEIVFDEEAIRTGTVAQCNHNLRCVNCSEKNIDAIHSATSRACPERIRQMGTTRDNNRTQDQGRAETDQFQTVPKKKTKTRKNAGNPQDSQAQTQSRFAVLEQQPETSSNTDEDLNMNMDHA